MSADRTESQQSSTILRSTCLKMNSLFVQMPEVDLEKRPTTKTDNVASHDPWTSHDRTEIETIVTLHSSSRTPQGQQVEKRKKAIAKRRVSERVRIHFLCLSRCSRKCGSFPPSHPTHTYQKNGKSGITGHTISKDTRGAKVSNSISSRC